LLMLRLLKKTLLPTSANANFIQLRSNQNGNPNELCKWKHSLTKLSVVFLNNLSFNCFNSDMFCVLCSNIAL
jgi:hypothetical protein